MTFWDYAVPVLIVFGIPVAATFLGVIVWYVFL